MPRLLAASISMTSTSSPVIDRCGDIALSHWISGGATGRVQSFGKDASGGCLADSASAGTGRRDQRVRLRWLYPGPGNMFLAHQFLKGLGAIANARPRYKSLDRRPREQSLLGLLQAYDYDWSHSAQAPRSFSILVGSLYQIRDRINGRWPQASKTSLHRRK